jgi:hypothetical protein
MVEIIYLKNLYLTQHHTTELIRPSDEKKTVFLTKKIQEKNDIQPLHHSMWLNVECLAVFVFIQQHAYIGQK